MTSTIEQLRDMCKWLKDVKGITQIEIFQLALYHNEYMEYKRKHPKEEKKDENGN